MRTNQKKRLRRRLFALVLGAVMSFPAFVTPGLAASTQTADPHKNDLLLWLGFDEGKGNTVSDRSGRMADATVAYGFTDAAFMPSRDPEWRDKGAEGGCLLFDGCTTYVEYPNSALAVSGSSLTVSAWVAPRAFDWDGPNEAAQGTDKLTAIVDQADRGARKGFVLGYQRHGVLSFQIGTGSEWLSIWSNGDNVTTYEWNYVTAVFDARAKEMAIYLNGERVASRSLAAGTEIAASDKPLMIGRNGSAPDLAGNLQYIPSGYLDEVKLYRCAFTAAEIAETFQSVTPAEIVFDELWHQNILTEDYTRPQFHAAPYQFWMNEPHAPIYYNGMYHLFFQQNLNGPYFAHLRWGHLVSPDMVNWKPIKEAIVDLEDSVAPDAAWSGGSTYDKNGVPLLFFTAGNDSYRTVEGLISNQNIGVAYPKDLGDPELTEWVIYDELAVAQKPGEGRPGEFRDPSIFKVGNLWCMVLCSGSPTGPGGAALLYTTDRLELRPDGSIDMNWQYKGPAYEIPHQPMRYGTSWELPNIQKLSNKAGTVSKYMLAISPAPNTSSVWDILYWLGSFDPVSGKFTPDKDFGTEPRMLDYGSTVFTGPSTFRDPVSGDVIMFSIMQDQRSDLDKVQSGWAHTAGLARKLWLTDDGSDVKIAPIDAIASLEETVLVNETNLSVSAANEKLAAVSGDLLHIQLTADVSKASQFAIELKKGGWMDCTSYTYDTASKTIRGWTANKAPGASMQTVSGPLTCKNGILEMNIYVDRSLVEAFFNSDKAITTRAYTVDPESQGISLFAQGEASIRSLRVATMGSIFANQVSYRFSDVRDPGSFYFDAVEWAATNGITAGKGSPRTFKPNDVCTRAEAVTFLYRAAGSPDAGAGDRFTDVPPTAYYASAVAWAAANGITEGKNAADAFAPDDTCTRAEIVSFLARYRKSADGDAGSFTDVAASDWFASGVGWAAARGITTGKGAADTFKPHDSCTRAEIVTFLYRLNRLGA